MALMDWEKKVLKRRVKIGKKCLLFLSHIMQIKSTNKFWIGTTVAERLQLINDRNNPLNATIIGQVNLTGTSKMGNCGEKAELCYFCAQNATSFTEKCYLIHCTNYDHAFVIVTSNAIYQPDDTFSLSDLEKLALVVDGWTEDWYFPNLGWLETVRYIGKDMVPTPEQFVVRKRTAAAECEIQAVDMT